MVIKLWFQTQKLSYRDEDYDGILTEWNYNSKNSPGLSCGRWSMMVVSVEVFGEII